MKTHWSSDGRVACLRPHGSLLGDDETEMLIATVKELAAKGNRALVIDLADVPFVNSLGLSAFIRLQKAYAEVGGVIRLSSLTKRVHSIFEIVKLCFLFDVYDSEQNAIAAFGAEAAAAPTVGAVPQDEPVAASRGDSSPEAPAGR